MSLSLSPTNDYLAEEDRESRFSYHMNAKKTKMAALFHQLSVTNVSNVTFRLSVTRGVP